MKHCPAWSLPHCAAALSFCSLVLAGCARSGAPAAAEPERAFSPPPTAAPKRCELPTQPPVLLHAASDPDGFPSARCVDKARALVAQMTLEEKLGQMLQAERGTARAADIARYDFGSILSGGGSGPAQNTPAEWARMVNGFREQSLKSRLGIPILYGVDAVHGHNNVRGAVIFPHNIGLGASRDPELVTRVGRATALEIAATGIDWTFSPVLAAARDERWGRTYESFGEAPELAELLGPALIRGLQGDHLGARPDGVLACAKHFLGDGYTEGGRDQGNSLLSREQMEQNLLPAYRKAIEAGVGSLMVSFSSVEGVKLHCSGPLLNDVLKGELGFGGFLVTDWRGIEQLPGDADAQLESAINAGVDMVMAPSEYTGFIGRMQSLVPGRIPLERVEDAAARILSVKCALGKLDGSRFRRGPGGALALPGGLDTLGSAEHRSVAREAVRRSLVLLDNHASLLPLNKSLRRIHVAGSHADDIGNQCGGWTIEWQGKQGPITPGTTLRQAFEAALPGGARVSYSLDGSGAAGADVAIAAIGEKPYAEGHGDDAKLQLDPAGLEVVSRLKAAGVPVVVVLMTGRPVLLGELSKSADALVAAWLPGTEAEGITDVLFGEHDFTGKLPHSWPRSLKQVPINVGDASYDPLFPYGFGLSYADQSHLAERNRK
ncbi:MAG: glycoside hydrolase family 3 N-terminal domain-containing protein [Deltaproteobacteria bacterium]